MASFPPLLATLRSPFHASWHLCQLGGLPAGVPLTCGVWAPGARPVSVQARGTWPVTIQVDAPPAGKARLPAGRSGLTWPAAPFPRGSGHRLPRQSRGQGGLLLTAGRVPPGTGTSGLTHRSCRDWKPDPPAGLWERWPGCCPSFGSRGHGPGRGDGFSVIAGSPEGRSWGAGLVWTPEGWILSSGSRQGGRGE